MIQRRNAGYFLRGLGRALDLRGASRGRYGAARQWHRSDHAATASDWDAVLRDLGEAYVRVKRSNGHDG